MISRLSPRARRRVAVVAPLLGVVPVMVLVLTGDGSWLTWVAASFFVAAAVCLVAAVFVFRHEDRRDH